MVTSTTTGGALGLLALLLAVGACTSKSGGQSGEDAGSGGNAGLPSGGGGGASSMTDGGEAGVSDSGGTTSMGGASGGVGGSSGASGAAAGASSSTGGIAGAAAVSGAAGAAGSEGTPAECEGAKSVEGDVVVSVGVETDELIRSISGNLTIYATVKELKQLRCLESIGGSLRVTVGSGADDLEALARLRSVGSAVIIEDTSYTSLAGLRSIVAYPPTLTIEGNRKLLDLTGFEGFTAISFLAINGNPALSNIEALSNMTGAASDLHIAMNDALTSLAGLEGLTSVTTNVTISVNASLRDLTGLDNLESIDGRVVIQDNPLLSTCEADEFVDRCEPSTRTITGNAPCD